MANIHTPDKKEIYVIDSETNPGDGKSILKPFLWVVYNGKKFNHFFTTREMLSFLFRLGKNIIAYAHNGGKFDFHFLLEFLPDFKALKVINGSIVKFHFKNIEFRDSYALIKEALPNTFHDYSLFNEGIREKYMTQIIEYAFNDVKILYDWIMAFHNSYGLSLTAASASMNYFIKIGGKMPKTSETYFNRFYPHYFGGRTQVFKKGYHKGPIYQYDINSAYPYAQTFDHPAGNILDYEPRMSWSGSNQSLITAEVIAEPNTFVRRKESGGLEPVLNESNTIINVTGWELNKALDLGRVIIVKIIKSYEFYKTINFKDFVLPLYDLKSKYKKSNDYRYIPTKIISNSLYGKLAQNPSKFRTNKIISINTEYDENEYDRSSQPLGDKMIISKPAKSGSYYNEATAASITGFGRALLLDAIHKAGNNIVYCDTDCVMSYIRLDIPVGDGLGMWELEKTYSRLYIHSPKTYCGVRSGSNEKIVRSKGIKASYDQIKDSVLNSTPIIHIPEMPIFSLHKGQYYQTRVVR